MILGWRAIYQNDPKKGLMRTELASVAPNHLLDKGQLLILTDKVLPRTEISASVLIKSLKCFCPKEGYENLNSHLPRTFSVR